MAKTIAAMIGRVLPRRRRNFARDEAGATLIEFGLLSLPFFMIVGAIMETSVVFLSGQVLDSAVQDTSRFLRTGQAREMGIVDTATFKTQLCGRLYGLFSDCNALHVEVRVVNNFSTISSTTISPPVDWNCTNNCGWTRDEAFSPGQGSSIVVVQVYYKWPVILNLGGFNLANLGDGRRVLGGSTVLRNEPFT